MRRGARGERREGMRQEAGGEGREGMRQEARGEGREGMRREVASDGWEPLPNGAVVRAFPLGAHSVSSVSLWFMKGVVNVPSANTTRGRDS